MKTKTIIRTEENRQRAIDLIGQIPLDKEHVVTIAPYSETLSQKQRALYFRWVGLMVPEMADTKDELHTILKEQFLVPLLVEHDEGFSDMAAAVIAVRRENPALAATLRLEILKLISIRDESLVTKFIMTEFMKAVEVHGNKFGFRLPRPGE